MHDQVQVVGVSVERQGRAEEKTAYRLQAAGPEEFNTPVLSRQL